MGRDKFIGELEDLVLIKEGDGVEEDIFPDDEDDEEDDAPEK